MLNMFSKKTGSTVSQNNKGVETQMKPAGPMTKLSKASEVLTKLSKASEVLSFEKKPNGDLKDFSKISEAASDFK